jgi:two-component SAPR family response regulator
MLKYDSGLYYFKKALIWHEKGKYTMQIAAINLVAGEYNRAGRYAEALEMSLQNLKLEQQLHDTNYIFFTKREIMWSTTTLEINKRTGIG